MQSVILVSDLLTLLDPKNGPDKQYNNQLKRFAQTVLQESEFLLHFQKQ
jgi:hypothetical protein